MLNASQFRKNDQADLNITRTDFHVADPCDLVELAQGFAEYLKFQRLHPPEINQWREVILAGTKLDPLLAQKITLALAEGILKSDLKTIDDDAMKGTIGQLVFHWIRTQYYGAEILYRYPELLTDSSKRQGLDYFEILGDPADVNTLYFIVWEVKATDAGVSTRTNEIYGMHRNRSMRLLRGLEMQISLQYPETTAVGKFARQLLDHWIANNACKRLGGAVVVDESNFPQQAFVTFHQQFPELHSRAARQIILVGIPHFSTMRSQMWTYLQSQMS